MAKVRAKIPFCSYDNACQLQAFGLEIDTSYYYRKDTKEIIENDKVDNSPVVPAYAPMDIMLMMPSFISDKMPASMLKKQRLTRETTPLRQYVLMITPEDSQYSVKYLADDGYACCLGISSNLSDALAISCIDLMTHKDEFECLE